MRKIVLASTSPYRQQLLKQLQIPFVTAAPEFDEFIDPHVSPALQVRHLAVGKAQSLASQYPDAVIIGSDQLFVDQRGRTLGKAGDERGAFQQLRQMAGRTHCFYTGLALLDSCNNSIQTDHTTFSVTMRSLTDVQIGDYLKRERPFDCAGSFKVEGLGIALIEKMEGEDYNALIGLPLIKLVTMLGQAGIQVLKKT